jgi:hypothetical protein
MTGVCHGSDPLNPEPTPAPAEVASPLILRPVEHELGLSLPDADAERGVFPMAHGLLDYFPNALAYVSWVSHIGNQQHNPGQLMHWAREKSTDHENKIMRHLIDRGRKDRRGVRHSGSLAWRALAMLQVELERDEGWILPRAAHFG